MTAADDITALSARLGLRDHAQDWGVCNADGGRAGEFIRACRAPGLTQQQQYALGGLVLASVNEALAEGVADDRLRGDFREFLSLPLYGLPAQVRYWASLPDRDEFPLAELLARELVA